MAATATSGSPSTVAGASARPRTAGRSSSSATHAIVAADPPDGIALREVGEARLAGFEQPERLFQVVADGLPEAFPEPRAARPWREEQPALLERAQELAAVDAAIAGAQTGAGTLVVIEGPAGIGKTSLLAAGPEPPGAPA